MLYMVEITYPREKRAFLLEYFQARGVTGYQAGVELKEAWVSIEECVAYALVKVDDANAFELERGRLAELGSVDSRHVMNAADI